MASTKEWQQRNVTGGGGSGYATTGTVRTGSNGLEMQGHDGRGMKWQHRKCTDGIGVA